MERNFRLANWHWLGQTSAMMKTLSGTVKYIVMAAIGIAVILNLRAFGQPFATPSEPPASKATFVLKIKNVTPVKDPAHFEQVLKQLKTQLYDLYTVDEKGARKHLTPGSSAQLDIKTDNVTTSEAAAKLTFIQTHTTVQIASMSPSDITTVLGELQ